MRIAHLILAGALFASSLFAGQEAYMIEGHVQADLDAALSRLIPQDQYLIQVTGEVHMRSERRVVEGETLSQSLNTQRETPPPAMPGFVPEPPEPREATNTPIQNRNTYRVVDTPVLAGLKVRATFDEALPAQTVTRAKSMIAAYLKSNYPAVSYVAFSTMPMIKSPKTLEQELAKLLNLKKDDNESFWAQMKWVFAAFLALVFLMMVFGRSTAAGSSRRRSGSGSRAPQPGFNITALADLFGAGRSESGEMIRPARMSAHATEAVQQQFFKRKRMLDKFLGHSEAFRMYFEQCTGDDKDEIYAALKGPAFDSLLDGMGFKRPVGADLDPESLEERMLVHEKNFDEYVAAKDWQEKQFFGFLSQLSDEQLLTICKREDARNVCVMLRFLRPNQSAGILDRLPASKRSEVIAYTSDVSDIPFSDLMTYEKGLRAATSRLPFATFGANKEDTEFWGSVLNESEHQEEIFNDLERTNPGLSPQLRKFKFKLEDAATLPDNLLGKVLGNVDNEELCLALSTCSEDVVEVFLDSMSASRKNILTKQMDTYRGVPKERGVAARGALTRKFREVLA
jgi:hypothetical protein